MQNCPFCQRYTEREPVYPLPRGRFPGEDEPTHVEYRCGKENHLFVIKYEGSSSKKMELKVRLDDLNIKVDYVNNWSRVWRTLPPQEEKSIGRIPPKEEGIKINQAAEFDLSDPQKIKDKIEKYILLS